MSGFVAAPGTDFSVGDEPEIQKRLDQLAQKLGVTIYGISGYRTPSHSVAVGGTANDPHTHGQAADIGVNGETRDSAGQISDAQLASVGLTRPFSAASEINHVQLASPAATARTAATVSPNGVQHGGGSYLQRIVSGPAPLPGTEPASSQAADAAGGVVETAVVSALGGIWDQTTAKAEYAGVFVVLVIAGVALAVFGVVRVAGRNQPEGATA